MRKPKGVKYVIKKRYQRSTDSERIYSYDIYTRERVHFVDGWETVERWYLTITHTDNLERIRLPYGIAPLIESMRVIDEDRQRPPRWQEELAESLGVCWRIAREWRWVERHKAWLTAAELAKWERRELPIRSTYDMLKERVTGKPKTDKYALCKN